MGTGGAETSVPTILYLDDDYLITLMHPDCRGMSVVIIPEIEAVSSFASVRDIPGSVVVRTEMALSPIWSNVYRSTRSLLDKIWEMTESGLIDGVIIGHNQGAGAQKAGAVAERLRPKSIVMANSYPPRKLYEPLGYRRFCPRFDLGDELKKLLGELWGWAVFAALFGIHFGREACFKVHLR